MFPKKSTGKTGAFFMGKRFLVFGFGLSCPVTIGSWNF